MLFLYVFYGLAFSVLLSMYGWTTVAGKIIKLKGKKTLSDSSNIQ